MPKALKSCPNSNKSPNLVTLISVHKMLKKIRLLNFIFFIPDCWFYPIFLLLILFFINGNIWTTKKLSSSDDDDDVVVVNKSKWSRQRLYFKRWYLWEKNHFWKMCFGQKLNWKRLVNFSTRVAVFLTNKHI